MEANTIILFQKKNECCGCSACMAICPRNAIIMLEDREGFLYPQIDENKCVQCGACIQTCPNRKDRSEQND